MAASHRSLEGEECKISGKRKFSFFFFFWQALFMRVEQFRGICARHSDSGSLKMLVGDGVNALIVS